jgi:hypothetical protein
MKKQFLFLLLPLFITSQDFAQLKWSRDSLIKINWTNYTQTYAGSLGDTTPAIITAMVFSNFIPYTGPPKISSEDLLLESDSGHTKYLIPFPTYDSSYVYFLSRNINKSNLDKYQYRVTFNAKTIIVPWSSINKFSNAEGFMGGYKTDWGNFITVELREKYNDSIIASSTIFWKETKPVVTSIYTLKNLDDFIELLKKSKSKSIKKSTIDKKLVFPSSENSIIFYLSATIYKKEALEYQLIKDKKVYREWGPNDFDNNFILLKELPPGKYILKIRYRAQRQNISDYDFEVEPQWQQTTMFKIIMGSLIAALFGFILLLFRFKKQKQELREAQANKDRLQLNLQSLRSQLNPHFIFNALSSIQALINKKETSTANEYLTSFSNLLRENLNYNGKEMIPLNIELKILETYIRLEQLRFHFKYTLTVSKELNTISIEIPTLLLQPLIENAVKHGISSLQEKGEIKNEFYSHEKNLYAKISDNGIGFDTTKETKGYGLKLTKERIDLLNDKLTNQQIYLSIESHKNAGTNFVLTFENYL